MAKTQYTSKTNQGARLGTGSKSGKTTANPIKPKLAAKVKNSQGVGGGVKQKFKGSAKGLNIVTSAKGRGSKTGVKQSLSLGSKRVIEKRATKLNLKSIKAQPKYEKKNAIQPHNNFMKYNVVAKGDVARMRKASQMPVPSLTGGSFGKFIKG
jgi:hypothetical protein